MLDLNCIFSIIRRNMGGTVIFKHINIVSLLAFMVISGCAVSPMPLEDTDIQAQAELDREAATANQEYLDRPIGLHEAITRAIKYNLDLRLEFAEKYLSIEELNLSTYDQLPELVGNIVYSGRDNFSGASSQSLITGAQSLATSTSSERDVISADLGLTWNILDFGVSYYRSKQAADRVLIAEEQKRAVINQLIAEVRETYWRAVSNEKVIDEAEVLMQRVSEAIEQSNIVIEEKLDKPLTALTYQRELIGIKRELENLLRELGLAKIQLAALMNVPPDQDYDIIIPQRTDKTKNIKVTPQMLEIIALSNRPELKEAHYQKRINAHEVKAQILSLLPGINLNFGTNYSENSFLFNNDWLSYGSQISYNLINLFRLPATKKALEAQDVVLDARRLALSMAVMTQVHVATAQYAHAKAEYQTAIEYMGTQLRILDQINIAAETNSVSEQTVIREQMNALVADVRTDIAYADLEAAYANVFVATGNDLVPSYMYNYVIEDFDVKTTTEAIRYHLNNIHLSHGDFSMKVDGFDTEKVIPITGYELTE